ncbi:MAG: O-antigen ligase family protein [Paraclostridium sordellii]
MKILIPVFGMMSINIFFAICGLIGYEYGGIENSKIYIIYCITIAIFNIYICFKNIIANNKINKQDCLFIMAPFYASILYLSRGIPNGYININSTKFFIYFILWSVPAIYAAIYVCRKKLLYSIVKWIDIIMIIYAVSIIFTIIIPFFKGIKFDTLGGSTYQNASYIAANAYGIILYFLFYGKNYERFKFTQTKIYFCISLVFICLQLIGIFISGGRGGIVLTFVYTILISFLVIKEKNKKNILVYFVYILLIITIFTILIPILMKNDVFISGYKRVFEFISSDGSINWDGTSNRNNVYKNAIDLIIEKPILGYGVFGYLSISPNPHNLILEILIGGGIVYLILSIIFSFGIFIKMLNLIKSDKRNLILLILMLYPITMLMFSGTYISNSEFWFVLTCIIVQPINRNIKV